MAVKFVKSEPQEDLDLAQFMDDSEEEMAKGMIADADLATFV